MEKPVLDAMTRKQLEEEWGSLSDEERLQHLMSLPRDEAEDLFFNLSASEQADIIRGLSATERRGWIRLLEPDDIADVIQAAAKDEQEELLSLLDISSRTEVAALLAYAEDVAGGLMNPRYARLRPEMSRGEAISYLQRQSREQAELISYAYVIDPDQRLLGLVSFRDLCAGNLGTRVQDLMTTDLITVSDQMDQEEIGRLFAETDLMALPVVDAEGKMKGIVTIDDIVDVVDEEATEDIQKLGGSEALGLPYLRVRPWSMIRKRAGWLMVLFIGEMLTATAMGYFEKEIAKAVVLAVFVPLIISSGGNAGSQASTIVIRAMALGEVRSRDFLRVAGREVVTGLCLGLMLGVLGFWRIVLWQQFGFGGYGEHYVVLGITVLCTVLGVVAWGTTCGATLPFILRSFGFDPATASTPFVATLVDVTGLLIYFETAQILLKGKLL